MLRFLASFLTGPIVNGVIEAYKARLDALNSQDRMAADLAAKAIEAEIEARRSADALILAEQGRWYTAIVRPLIAFPVVIYLWKVVVWDKVLGLGTTDAIAGDVAAWAGAMSPSMSAAARSRRSPRAWPPCSANDVQGE